MDAYLCAEQRCALPLLIRRMETLRDELDRHIESLRERSNAEPSQVKLVRLPPQTVYRRVYTTPSMAERTTLLRSTALEGMRLYGTDISHRLYLVESPIDRPEEIAFRVAVPPESRGEHVALLPAVQALSRYHHGAYRLSGAKKSFALPEEEIRRVIAKQNRHRGVFTPTDRKAYYETVTVNGFPCLIVRENPKPSRRAILYFFGGGMVIGPDKGDLPVMRKLMRDTGCDVWFPFYPLCAEHCITETYDMVYACYRRMIELYGGGNVSTCGFSSGGALALGIAAHNNAQPQPLPQPRHIVAVSPGEVLYGALPDFEEACRRADVPYTAFARPGMVHCYCMLPCFGEAKEDFAKIADILKK